MRAESSTQGRRRGKYNSRYDKSSVQCYNCHKFGHYSKECRAPNNRVREKTNYAEQKSEDCGTLLLARNADNGGQENTWYLDTGSSNHICWRKSCLGSFNELVSGNVSFGDDVKIPFKGKGNILIRLRDGRHQLISNVFYVPNMKNNILSLG